ncbi:MAG: hypothetical protein PVI26_09455 [Chitinispirillia bacterium]|jgi:tetratricopeptide (TPR) repeat protein
MSSRKKKKNRNKHVNSKTRYNQLPEHTLVKQADQFSDMRNYVKAREIYKQLLQINPDKYREKLANCYKKLVIKAIIEKKYSEAKKNLNQIAAVSGKEVCFIEHVIIAVKENNLNAACKFCIDLLENNSLKTNSDILIVADTFILSYSPPKQLEILAPALYSDVQSVILALNCIAEGQFDRAINAVRTVHISSPAAHWRLFIKGVVAYYKGEDEKAGKCFCKIPPDSLVHNASRTFLACMHLKEQGRQEYKNEKLLKNVCILTGNADIVSVLPRAEYLWRSGRKRDSFKYLRKSIPNFPDKNIPVQKELAFFYYINSYYIIKDHESGKFIDSIFDTVNRNGANNSLEMFMIAKLNAMTHHPEDDYFQNSSSVDSVIKVWEEYISAYKKIYPDDTSIDMIFFLFWGIVFSKPVENIPSSMFGFFNPVQKKTIAVRDKTIAERYLKKAIACSKKNIEPYLKLLDLYRLIKQPSKMNKLLDSMVLLFPENKDVLVQAGLRCYNRKAYVKGVSYLEQAFKLDSLDISVKEYLILSYIQIAKKKPLSTNYKIIKELYENSRSKAGSDPENFNTGLPYIQIRWALLAFKFGKEKDACDFIRSAEKNSPNRFRLHYFLFSIHKDYSVKPETISKTEMEISAVFRQEALSKYAVDMAKVYEYVDLLYKNNYSIHSEQNRVEKYISRISAKNADIEDIRYIVYFLIKRYESGSFHIKKMADSLCEKMLKTFKNDPYLMFYSWYLKFKTTYYLPSGRDIEKLEKIKSSAKKINAMDLINKIDSSINDINEKLKFYNNIPGRFPPIPDMDFFEDDDEDEDDWESWEDEDNEIYQKAKEELENIKKTINRNLEPKKAKKKPSRKKKKESQKKSIMPDAEQLTLF